MKRVNRNAKRRGIWRFGFGKTPGPDQDAKKPVVSKAGAHGEGFSFVLHQLSYQSTYFPELAKKHNALLKKPEFHPETDGKASPVLVITGKRGADNVLASNFHKMLELEKKINEFRLAARRIRNLDHAKEVVDKARLLENQFNELKAKNYNIFLEHFPQAKK